MKYTLKETGIQNIMFFFDKIDDIHDYLVEKFKSALKQDIALIDKLKQPYTILEILKHYENIFETLQIEVIRYYVDCENGIVLTNYNKSVTVTLRAQYMLQNSPETVRE